MKINVLRGKNQIGGSITEIDSGTTRIYIDFGAELPSLDYESTDAQMIREIQKNLPTAVLFSHCHGDHIGLLSAIPEGVDIYIGAIARRVMINIRETLLCVKNIEGQEREHLKLEYDILKSNRVHEYNTTKTEMRVGDITFVPFVVDHSAPDSYMFRISCGGKTIVHTGDFRNHGRLGKDLIDTIKNEVANVPVDYLITEGTMMSRTQEKVLTEEQLQRKATEILKDNKYAFLICSSTNMESLASFYWATISSGEKKALYVNGYVKRQLELFTDTYGTENRAFQFYRSYVIESQLKKQLKTGQTQEEYMRENGFLMMVGTSEYYRKLMNSFADLNPVLIYSMWEGYLKDGPAKNKELSSFIDSWNGKLFFLHTSGHAGTSLIEEIINIINPRDAIIPIHTDNIDGFDELDIPERLKRTWEGTNLGQTIEDEFTNRIVRLY